MFHPDSGAGQAHAAKMPGRKRNGVERSPTRGFDGWAPEATILGLRVLHYIPNIDGSFRDTFRIDKDRQVTADAESVEVVEEEKSVASQQILDVVLRRDQHDINAGIVQQRVEVMMVEWEIHFRAGCLPVVSVRQH